MILKFFGDCFKCFGDTTHRCGNTVSKVKREKVKETYLNARATLISVQLSSNTKQSDSKALLKAAAAVIGEDGTSQNERHNQAAAGLPICESSVHALGVSHSWRLTHCWRLNPKQQSLVKMVSAASARHMSART